MRWGSRVVMLGCTCGAIIFSTSAASRPATRIFSISSGVFRVIAMTYRVWGNSRGFYWPALYPILRCRCQREYGIKARFLKTFEPNPTHGSSQASGCLLARLIGGRLVHGTRGGQTRIGESTEQCDTPADAGGRRAFRPPVAVLAPQDAPLHLRGGQQGLHH